MLKRKGFTLIELIMVIVLIAILAVIAIPRFINLRREAQKAACAGTGGAIRSALYQYYARQAVSRTHAFFPRTVHDVHFLNYLAEGTLPPHPLGWDWNAYYSTWDAVSGYGPRQARFKVGQPPSSEGGACSGW